MFWETASVDSFESPADRNLFRYKYLEYYRDAAPELFLVAVAERTAPAEPDTAQDAGPVVYGYICGVADTREHRELYRVAAHIPVFDDLYEQYPAHLHINLTAASRGHGLGGRLITDLEERLRRDYRSRGIHLVTSEGARNVSFYRKNGFTVEVPRAMSDAPARPDAPGSPSTRAMSDASGSPFARVMSDAPARPDAPGSPSVPVLPDAPPPEAALSSSDAETPRMLFMAKNL